jgi:uncharacterized protein YdaT
VRFGCVAAFLIDDKISLRRSSMPWYNGDYPPSYKNQPADIRAKAVEIANELLLHGSDEGVAIATGLKRAREFFKDSQVPAAEKSTGKRKKINRGDHE